MVQARQIPSFLFRFFNHFNQIRRNSCHSHGNDSLNANDHPTVSCPFHLYKDAFIPREVSPDDAHPCSFSRIDFLRFEKKQMLVIRACHGYEVPHLPIGHNDFLTATRVSHILKIRNIFFQFLHISLCDMDKDKIMNYWDQLAHLTFLCHADNIMYGNETGYSLLVQQILHIQFATVSDPHGKPLCFFTTKHTLGALKYVYLSVLQLVTLPFRIIQEVFDFFL